MRQNNEKKHLVLKIIALLVALFLIFIGVADFSPKQETIEKTVSYADKK